MTVDECLRVLECDNTTTLDELKSKYRLLSKKYHPDLNQNIDPKLFIRLTEAYDYLVGNYKPTKKRAADTAPPSNRFYRIWDGKHPMVIELPVSGVLEETSIYCFIDNGEYRIRLEKGTVLPVELELTNIKFYPSFKVVIKEEKSWKPRWTKEIVLVVDHQLGNVPVGMGWQMNNTLLNYRNMKRSSWRNQHLNFFAIENKSNPGEAGAHARLKSGRTLFDPEGLHQLESDDETAISL
jgi:hypothetical protein